MYTIDFEYDGKCLSDFGLMLCQFDSSGGLETVSSGADITFNTTKSVGSNRTKMYGSKYEETYSSVFQVCKNPCANEDMYLEPNKVSSLQRWLCRKDDYHPFKPIQDDLQDIYWNATFSCKQIEINGKIVGLELTMYTDSPYAYLMVQPITYLLNSGDEFSLFDSSDEVGYIYPYVEILCNGDGKLALENSFDTKKTELTNLTNGEIIILDGENKIISSSISRDNLPNSFNYYYPRIFNKIVNGVDIRENIFKLSDDSIPCTITFKYSPITKIGL